MLAMSKRHYDNKRELKQWRRDLRRRVTPAEIKLWHYLRNKQLGGYRFQRQLSVEWFILDYYCHERKLAIEADAYNHNNPEQMERDNARTQILNTLDIRVLRFWSHEILNDTEAVLARILTAFESPHPLPSPSPAPLEPARPSILLPKGGEQEVINPPTQNPWGSLPLPYPAPLIPNPHISEANP